MEQADEQRFNELALEAGRIFTPSTPINEKDLFSGRVDQIRRVIDAINQDGLHAIIFGERGVGKTSLGNVLSEFLVSGVVLAPRINCNAGDTFQTLWAKVFGQVEILRSRPRAGFDAEPNSEQATARDLLRGEATPDSVRMALSILAVNAVPVVIIDEFDRLQQEPRRELADMIKGLSDHGVRATIILIGVGDAIDHLIQDHESISRALIQVQMPRMSEQEIEEIVSKGFLRLGIGASPNVAARITHLAQGLPHYAHLVALKSVRCALDDHSMTITEAHLKSAIGQALADAQHSIRSAYHQAIRSTRPNNLFADVLLACALAKTDELGFFAAQDVRSPMREVTGKNYEIPSYAQHLNEFSDEKRGRVLFKTGDRRRYRYRFKDPLMQPFVIMRGVFDSRIPESYLD
ncbi:MAG: ATP-binding protein [Candidatus Krumholzibacteriia bacterium]